MRFVPGARGREPDADGLRRDVMHKAPSRSVLLAALIVFAALGAACNVLPGAVPSAGGPLVTVSTRGGECPTGMCESQVVIERDGRVHALKPAVKDFGKVPANALTALEVAIRTSDFGAIRSKPFTGECPVNFDGQEVIYEFTTPSGVERIASCEVEIDESHPLFLAVTRALVITEG